MIHHECDDCCLPYRGISSIDHRLTLCDINGFSGKNQTPKTEALSLKLSYDD